MENKKCEHCGASIKIYKHNLTVGLVETFKKFAMAVKTKGVNDIHLQRETDLNRNQYNNFQKLRYFGLVHHVKIGGKVMAGRWLVTKKGWAFLRGDLICRKWTKTFRNKIYEVPEFSSDIGAQIVSSDYKFIFEFNKLDTKEYYQREFDFEVFTPNKYDL